MEHQFFKNDSKQIIDIIFNNHLFKDYVTRDDMNGFEELIQFFLQSRFESYIKTKKLFDRVEENRKLNSLK